MRTRIYGYVMTMACCLAVQSTAGSYGGPDKFDFTHIEAALRYHLAPSERLLNEVSSSTAAVHLKRHSDRTGYYPVNSSTRDITYDLLREPPSQETVQAVRELLSYAERNSSKQRECMATAAMYLPEKAQPRNPLHVTWGYDIGVAMDDHASLNFAHPHFLADHQEIWFYCIHETHHSGVMQIHPMPRVADIDTVRELFDFARYATYVEGLAVHAAREARRSADALGSDNDYVALEDPARLSRTMAAFEERLAYLLSEVDEPLLDNHWAVIEDMSSGDRLWYVAGAAMAAAIEGKLGRDELLNVISLGPEAFFEAYGHVNGHTDSTAIGR